MQLLINQIVTAVIKLQHHEPFGENICDGWLDVVVRLLPKGNSLSLTTSRWAYRLKSTEVFALPTVKSYRIPLEHHSWGILHE